MRRIARYIYVGVAWLALVSLIIAIFVAGMALFVQNSFWIAHREIGWNTGLPLLLLIITGLIGWIPRRLTAWLVALIVLHSVHTIVPSARDSLPMIAAVHPVTAVILAWLALTHARLATKLLIEPGSSDEAVSSAAGTS